MITKSVHESKHTKINGYEVEQKSLVELKEENAILKHENSQKENKIKKLEAILAQNNIII